MRMNRFLTVADVMANFYGIDSFALKVNCDGKTRFITGYDSFRYDNFYA
jgi:hypothetical protein